MIVCHIISVVWQINLWSHTYTVLFELCVCLCITAQGKYHCKFIRWTAYSICINDALVSADEMFDFLTYSASLLLPIITIAAGLTTTIALAINHYIRVKRLKRIWEPRNKNPRS